MHLRAWNTQVELDNVMDMTSPDLKACFKYRRLSESEIRSYEEDGFLVLDEVLTPLGLERMRGEAMAAWEKEHADYDPAKSWLQNQLLADVHHHSKTIRDYYFDGPLVDVAEQLVSPNLKAVTAQLTFKLPGNTKVANWHQDNNYGELDPYNAMSCLTALDDADTGNGCLWVLPRSHRSGQRLQRTLQDRLERKVVRMKIDHTEGRPISMKAGQCLIIHCWMLHKSEGNHSKDRSRRVLFLRYADADAVEVYNDNQPRLGRLVRGQTRFPEVAAFEAEV
jgi:hypothetical protein